MKTLHAAARAQVRAQDADQKGGRRQTKRPTQHPASRPAHKRKNRRSGVAHSLLSVIGAGGAAAFALGVTMLFNPVSAAQARPLLVALHVLEAPSIETVTQPLVTVDVTPIAPNPNDVHLLAATTWAEARGEGAEGMRAVAHVIVNRIGPRFGGDLSTVILSPKQFSAWNLHDPNRPLAQNPERYATSGENLLTWEEAQQVALEVLSGRSKDPTAGALFYHAAAIHPYWSRYGLGKQQIGGHVFYSDVPDHPTRG